MSAKIIDTALPAVAAGAGPFIREDTGGGGGGFSAYPGGGAGAFGLPCNVDEKLTRAIEAHEYMHLSTDQFIPQLRAMGKVALNLGISNMAMQAVLDDFVHCVGTRIPEINRHLQDLTFTPDGKGLDDFMKELPDQGKMLLGIRARAIDQLTRMFCDSTGVCWNAELAADIKAGEREADVDVSEEESIRKSNINLRYSAIQGNVERIHGQVKLAANTAISGVISFPWGIRTISDFTKHLRDTFTVPDDQLKDLDCLLELPFKATGNQKANVFVMAQLINAMKQATDAADVIEKFSEEADTSMMLKISFPEAGTLKKKGDPDRIAEETHRQALEQALGGSSLVGSSGVWGTMMKIDMEFTDTIKARIAHRKVRYGYDGPFRYPHRIPPAGDGTCFGHKRKIRGGTLLIDMSGSMSLDTDDIHTIILALPAAVIAGYGGKRSKGQLVILAKDGRMVDLSEARAMIGEGNIIDGPSLRWLNQQKRPRIWVSDGIVTGVGDTCEPNLDAEAMREVVKSGIIWLKTIDQVKDFIREHPNMFLS